MLEKIEKFFKFKEYHTDLKTETIAGLTTFVAMAYILAVNPSILSAAGMNSGAVYTATALSAFLGTLFMALMANYPFALAPGMGVNAYFAYTVVLQMGYSWEMALGAVFIEGVIFILLTLTNVREKIFEMFPVCLRLAITAGIGLYITMIGLINANIMVDNESTLVALYNFAGAESFSLTLTVILTIIGILITAYFYIKGWTFGLLGGILVTWMMGIFCQLVGLYVPDPELGLYSLLPDFTNAQLVQSISPTFMKMAFPTTISFDFIIVLFAFLSVDFFDTIGTLIGCSIKAGYIKADEPLPRMKQAMLADALGTTVGAILGTSTVTVFVESSLGVTNGGRTGFTALVVAVMFLLSLFLAPIFLAIPSWATAPALVIVGFLMMQSVTDIDFKDLTEGLPAFLCIVSMPMFYSIAEGIGWGVISYTFLNSITGKFKKVSPLMYGVSLFYLLKYFFI